MVTGDLSTSRARMHDLVHLGRSRLFSAGEAGLQEASASGRAAGPDAWTSIAAVPPARLRVTSSRPEACDLVRPTVR